MKRILLMDPKSYRQGLCRSSRVQGNTIIYIYIYIIDFHKRKAFYTICDQRMCQAHTLPCGIRAATHAALGQQRLDSAAGLGFRVQGVLCLARVGPPSPLPKGKRGRGRRPSKRALRSRLNPTPAGAPPKSQAFRVQGSSRKREARVRG